MISDNLTDKLDNIIGKLQNGADIELRLKCLEEATKTFTGHHYEDPKLIISAAKQYYDFITSSSQSEKHQ